MKLIKGIEIFGIVVLAAIGIALASMMAYVIGQELGIFPDQFSTYKHLE